jgi:hypothetical protein
MAENFAAVDTQLRDIYDFFNTILGSKKEKTIFRDFFRFLESSKSDPLICDYINDLWFAKSQSSKDTRFLMFCELVNLKLQLNLYNEEDNTELDEDLGTSIDKAKLDRFVRDETNNDKLASIIVNIQLKEIWDTFTGAVTDEEASEIAVEFLGFLDSSKQQSFIQDFISQLWTHKNSCAKSQRFIMDCELVNLKRAANKYCPENKRKLMRDLEFIISPYTREEED